MKTEEIIWTSRVYPRFHLTAEELRRLVERFVPPGILGRDQLNLELHKAGCWLRDNPTRAARKYNWYKFINNWLKLAEEYEQSRAHRGRASVRRAPDERDIQATRTRLNSDPRRSL